ncbi:UNVERIFIED_ORG: putative XRE-type DNA-binding protein [Bacillus sp. B2I3]|nr:putative XRE-type DNA-binding protein [Bacillus sp. B2I3]
MERKNLDIRKALHVSGIPQWKLAEECNVSESQFSRLMRKELSVDEKGEIFSLIEKMKKEFKEVNE